MSIFKFFDLPPAFGASVLTLAVILTITPYFSGADFGLFKVPLLNLRTGRRLRVIGPLILAVILLAFAPVLPKEGETLTPPSTTSVSTLGPTSPEKTETDPARTRDLARATKHLQAIDAHIEGLNAILSSDKTGTFFGPYNSQKVKAHLGEWVLTREQVAAIVERCRNLRDQCDLTKLKEPPTLNPLPLPGKRIPIIHGGKVTGDLVNIQSDVVTELLTGREGYRHPLTIRIAGEWSSTYAGGNAASVCGTPVATALHFFSDDADFYVHATSGQRVVESITKTAVIRGPNTPGFAAPPDSFTILNWPANRELSVSVVDDDYGDNRVCAADRPAIAIWETDPRLFGR